MRGLGKRTRWRAAAAWAAACSLAAGGLVAAGVVVAAAATAAPGQGAQPAAASPVCQIAYTVNSDWGTGFSIAITITNNGPAITSWTLGYSYSGNQKIAQGWSGNCLAGRLTDAGTMAATCTDIGGRWACPRTPAALLPRCRVPLISRPA